MARRAKVEEKKSLVIARVLSEVQRAVQNARIRTAGSDFPQLDAVTITLQTVIVKAGGFKIKFLVFSFGQTWEQQRSHEMVLTLKPTRAAGASVRTLADGLEDAIVDAAEGVKDALTGTPPLCGGPIQSPRRTCEAELLSRQCAWATAGAILE